MERNKNRFAYPLKVANRSGLEGETLSRGGGTAAGGSEASPLGIPKGVALGAPLVTFPATGKSPGVEGRSALLVAAGTKAPQKGKEEGFLENWFYIALAAAAALLLAAAIWKLLRRANPWSRAPYERQAYFLSPAEKAFYDVLDALVGEDVVICPKPAVREVLRVRGNIRRDRQKYFNWISQKHVDFVLCDRETMQILCAVELDDSSHERADRRQRDAFMDKAFRKAKLPLFHIPCRKSYGAKELNELCSFLCQDLLVLEDDEGPDKQAPPLCPDCGVPMVLRTASRGPHQGEQFYGCPNFPRCRRTRPYRGE